MIYSLEIKEEARQDILEASQYYEEQKEGLGEIFAETIFNHIQYLEHYPLSQQCKYKENRELTIKKFPYVIVYRLENKTVIVLAVAHCKQHPSKKRKRK